MKKENEFTRSDAISNPYDPVTNPQIGQIYHLSWAYKGATFELTKIIDPIYGEVYTGEKNKKTLKIKLSDLRQLRNK